MGGNVKSFSKGVALGFGLATVTEAPVSTVAVISAEAISTSSVCVAEAVMTSAVLGGLTFRCEEEAVIDLEPVADLGTVFAVDKVGKFWGERGELWSGGSGGLNGGSPGSPGGSPAATDGGFRPEMRPGTFHMFCIGNRVREVFDLFDLFFFHLFLKT